VAGPARPVLPRGLALVTLRRPGGFQGSGLRTHNQITSSPEKEVSQISKPAEQKVKRMNLNVPVELHNSFKSVTAAQGQNMTDILMEFIKTYVTKHSPKARRR
jgi:ParG